MREGVLWGGSEGEGKETGGFGFDLGGGGWGVRVREVGGAEGEAEWAGAGEVVAGVEISEPDAGGQRGVDVGDCEGGVGWGGVERADGERAVVGEGYGGVGEARVV